jgi:hypothetical protein
MKTLTATSSAPKLVLLAFALAMPALTPTSARGDDSKRDESPDPGDARDPKTDRSDGDSDPVPPIVCDDDGDKKDHETQSGEPGRRRQRTPYDSGRCVDPTPIE